MSIVERPRRKPHWLSGSITSATCVKNRLSITLAKILPPTHDSEMTRLINHLNNVPINENLPIFFSIFSHFIHSTFLQIPDIFNLIEWEGMLSSRCILNMKRLVTLKCKQKKTSKASQESDLEVCQRFHGIVMIGTNIGTPKVASPNGLNSKTMKLEQSDN